MSIGKNAIKRVENNGYSKVKTSAPDMENSNVIANLDPQVEEKLIAPVEKATKAKSAAKTAAKKPATKKTPAKTAEKAPVAEEKKPACKKTVKTPVSATKKSSTGKSSTKPISSQKTANKPVKKQNKIERVSLGSDMPYYLL